MPVNVVVGAQWGDEGKGKIVDFCAQRSDMVIRFNGGANAGHTLVVGGKTYKLHHLPSGILYPEKINIIGNGTVLDPKKLLEELSMLQKGGIFPQLAISPRAHVVMPYHFVLDGAEEEKKGASAAGTTKRGIGPCYSDKASRFGIRVADLMDEPTFRSKLSVMHSIKIRTIEGVYGLKLQETEEQILRQYLVYADKLRPYVKDTMPMVHEAISGKKTILLEAAQGSMIDIDHGLYPFGTSSSTTAGGACTGSGIGPTQIDEVIGVVKAYTSRVGGGPIPTELKDATGDAIRDKGGEFGTTTGRPRRIGWLDIVTLRHSAQVNGMTGLAFTRVDTLSGIDTLKVCTHYSLDGNEVHSHPPSSEGFSRCKPKYEELDGWEDVGKQGWQDAAKRGYKALPKGARAYLEFISKSVGVPIYIVSVGPGREETIVLKDIFRTK